MLPAVTEADAGDNDNARRDWQWSERLFHCLSNGFRPKSTAESAFAKSLCGHYYLGLLIRDKSCLVFRTQKTNDPQPRSGGFLLPGDGQA